MGGVQQYTITHHKYIDFAPAEACEQAQLVEARPLLPPSAVQGVGIRLLAAPCPSKVPHPRPRCSIPMGPVLTANSRPSTSRTGCFLGPRRAAGHRHRRDPVVLFALVATWFTGAGRVARVGGARPASHHDQCVTVVDPDGMTVSRGRSLGRLAVAGGVRARGRRASAPGARSSAHSSGLRAVVHPSAPVAALVGTAAPIAAPRQPHGPDLLERTRTHRCPPYIPTELAVRTSGGCRAPARSDRRAVARFVAAPTRWNPLRARIPGIPRRRIHPARVAVRGWTQTFLRGIVGVQQERELRALRLKSAAATASRRGCRRRRGFPERLASGLRWRWPFRTLTPTHIDAGLDARRLRTTFFDLALMRASSMPVVVELCTAPRPARRCSATSRPSASSASTPSGRGPRRPTFSSRVLAACRPRWVFLHGVWLDCAEHLIGERRARHERRVPGRVCRGSSSGLAGAGALRQSAGAVRGPVADLDALRRTMPRGRHVVRRRSGRRSRQWQSCSRPEVLGRDDVVYHS